MWYRKAAKAGLKLGSAWLGYFYSHGINHSSGKQKQQNRWNNIEKNYAKALKWYERAAKQRLDVAEYMTGFLYAHGEERLGRGPLMRQKQVIELSGIPLDYEKAAYWYKKAAEQGFALGMRWLGYFYYRGNYAVERNYKLAFEWYQKAADNKDIISIFSVETCYEDGLGTDKDFVLAFHRYMQAARAGDKLSTRYVGLCYENGIGALRSERLAKEWYTKAANLGDAWAKFKLILPF